MDERAGGTEWARAEAARLSEARLAVVECHLQARLDCGEASELVAELEALTGEYRLRERLWALRMLALYRSGRQAEALGAYQQLRAILVEELGVDPGAELRRLHQQILAQDPALAVASPGSAATVLAARPTVVPRQLPAGARFFAGREAELKDLDELLDRAGGEGGAVVISAVAGMAGVGKTAQLAGASDAGGAAAGQPVGGEGQGRLAMLETGDAATSLRELLSWSHRQLSPSAAAMLAVLGVHCGPDIAVAAAASLAGVPRADADRSLAELAEASLIAEHRPGRYVLHDLVRAYACGHARQSLGEAGIREAVGRSLDHYLHTMASSSDFPWRFTLAPPAPGVAPEHLADDAGLVDWAQAEDQVLLQATVQAAATGFLTHAWQIFFCLGFFASGQGWYWADFPAVGQAMLAAAEAAGDQAALGWTHANMGWYSTFTGAHDEDRAHQSQALDIFQRIGDLHPIKQGIDHRPGRPERRLGARLSNGPRVTR